MKRGQKSKPKRLWRHGTQLPSQSRSLERFEPPRRCEREETRSNVRIPRSLTRQVEHRTCGAAKRHPSTRTRVWQWPTNGFTWHRFERSPPYVQCACVRGRRVSSGLKGHQLRPHSFLFHLSPRPYSSRIQSHFTSTPVTEDFSRLYKKIAVYSRSTSSCR